MVKIARFFSSYHLAIKVFLFVSICLTMVQINVARPMLMAERFLPGAGWIEILVLAVYGALLIEQMKDVRKVEKWRKISWMIFSVVFFSQLVLGIFINEKFLMTGKLHLPVPAMILSGPVYRGEISFMTILFLSTVLLSGPAWCSQLCYFGAFDNLASSGKGLRNRSLKDKMKYKHTILLLVVVIALLLRLTGVSNLYATAGGMLFGLLGFGIIIFISRRKKQMVQCTVYCPIGTITSYLKYISPFRMYIDTNCTTCMACTVKCKYDALQLQNIRAGKPGITCTYCGDCLTSCHQQSIKYKFFRLSSDKARNLYLVITISIHVIFIALGRI